jgi:hypothetical protein
MSLPGEKNLSTKALNNDEHLDETESCKKIGK